MYSSQYIAVYIAKTVASSDSHTGSLSGPASPADSWGHSQGTAGEDFARTRPFGRHDGVMKIGARHSMCNDILSCAFDTIFYCEATN